ncbi:hypothetical protein D3C87_838910 [compost metagenome]
MSNANEMRKALEIVNEAQVPQAGVDQNKNVRVAIETLGREAPSRGRYDFNKGFLTFQDILDDPNPFIGKYRKESQQDTSNLAQYIGNMKPNAKLTDKEKYLRDGYESRGFSNGRNYLVWYKDKKESLFIFASSKDDHMQIRDFLKFFNVIR